MKKFSRYPIDVAIFIATFMATFIATFFTAFAAVSFVSPSAVAAQIIYVQGRGRDMGYCNYTGGSFCLSGVKANAERGAMAQASQSCQFSRGTPLSYTASCNSSCFPNILNPGDTNVNVSCSSDCRVQCQVNK
ncbi:MAG: hypothetical protein H7326_01685 [Bdellovibrionaceae bacterium]|nr:hypothetical protein [Pseudobdellovibrionaceae bacterium]